MKITITGRKVNLRENFKERVEKKLGKFNRIFGDEAEAIVTVTLESKNRQRVEVTIRNNGMVYRAENTSEEMNDALDSVVNVLGRQIRKNKTKLSKKLREGTLDDFIANDEATEDILEETYEVAKQKVIPVKPLAVDEAILQMNMVGHKFFMFRNAETGEINVVYCRDDGKYGLLVPD
ncbi:MAG: ribosome hibernation-promoting factor, HPF/YfiA family [Acutalibacteraceae bacterium]